MTWKDRATALQRQVKNRLVFFSWSGQKKSFLEDIRGDFKGMA